MRPRRFQGGPRIAQVHRKGQPASEEPPNAVGNERPLNRWVKQNHREKLRFPIALLTIGAIVIRSSPARSVRSESVSVFRVSASASTSIADSGPALRRSEQCQFEDCEGLVGVLDPAVERRPRPADAPDGERGRLVARVPFSLLASESATRRGAGAADPTAWHRVLFFSSQTRCYSQAAPWHSDLGREGATVGQALGRER